MVKKKKNRKFKELFNNIIKNDNFILIIFTSKKFEIFHHPTSVVLTLKLPPTTHYEIFRPVFEPKNVNVRCEIYQFGKPSLNCIDPSPPPRIGYHSY